MKKIFLTLIMAAIAAISSAQTVCPPGQINQLAKWRFLYKQCYDSALVLKYVPTGEVAYVTAAGELHTISFSALLDSLNVPETDSSIFATRVYVNHLVDSLGALTNFTYPNTAVLYAGSNGKPTTDITNLYYLQNTKQFYVDSTTIGDSVTHLSSTDSFRFTLNGFPLFHFSGGDASTPYGNMFFGYGAGLSFTGTGFANTVYGRFAGQRLAGTAPNASSNALFGHNAGRDLSTGSFNTVVGVAAFVSASTTVQSTAVGYHSLQNVTGDNNTAVGSFTMGGGSSTSTQSTVVGSLGFFAVTTGNFQTGIGYETFTNMTTGSANTGLGYRTGFRYTSGDSNTFGGYRAGFGIAASSTGSGNSGYGASSLERITTGNHNIAIGKNAGFNLSSGSRNIVIGYNIDLTSNTGNDQLNIGGVIFGTGMYSSTGSVGINSAPNASAALTVTSTTKGFLPPVMTATQASAIATPAQGLMVFVTSTNGTFTAIGWWGWDGSTWVKLN